MEEKSLMNTNWKALMNSHQEKKVNERRLKWKGLQIQYKFFSKFFDENQLIEDKYNNLIIE